MRFAAGGQIELKKTLLFIGCILAFVFVLGVYFLKNADHRDFIFDEENTREELPSEINFDYEKLGVEPHTYVSSLNDFKLSDAQKGAILLLVDSYYNWTSEDAYDDEWWNIFQKYFLQNYYDYGCKYFNGISEIRNQVTKEEAEYLQYSLTGEKILCPEENGEVITISDYVDAPFIKETTIEEYTVEGNSETVLVHATLHNQHVSYDKELGEVIADCSWKIDVVLKRNPYSCFDGYSIMSIKETDDIPSDLL